MKKSLLILTLAGTIAGTALTSCDPLKAEGDFKVSDITTENLLAGATFGQFDQIKDDNGNIQYVPSETGNYIQYNIPSVQAVNIYVLKADGDKRVLSYGRSGGMIYYYPSRGSDPQQTIYFEYIQGTGESIVAEKTFTLNVAQALDGGMKALVSEAGSKKWKWMPTKVNGGAVWGNGGYAPGPQDGGLDINGSWWGCGVNDGNCPDTFSGQTQHAGDKYDQFKGQCDALSYMVFNEDGSLNTFDPDGNSITTGSFTISGYDNNNIVNEETFSRGTLGTSEGAILWPFAINTGGMMPTEFEIGWLDPMRMVLIYAAPDTGAWSECTWWSFMSDDDPGAALASQEWHWKATSVNGGAVWGNGGYAAGAQSGDGSINGAWWGCGTEDGECGDKFSGQTQHAGDKYDQYKGDTYNASKMVFNSDEGILTVFNENGEQIRQGSFSVDKTPNAETFSNGILNTSAGLILWPFAINTGGEMPTSFEIGYLGQDAMILIYAAPDTGAWSECTWWSFGK